MNESEVIRDHEKLKRFIRVNSYIAIVFAIASAIVTGIVFHQSTVLTADRKVYFSGILGVCAIGLLIIVFVSRTEPVALLIFSTLFVYVSALTLGLSIAYGIAA